MWKPIEGAPRDGTAVLGAQIKNGKYVISPIAVYFGTYTIGKKGHACWRDHYNGRIVWPTHFQPLPSTEVEP